MCRCRCTDIVPERGDEATAKIMSMTGGIGVDTALECLGTGQSMTTAFSIARVGSIVGAIDVPHDVIVPIDTVPHARPGDRPRSNRIGLGEQLNSGYR